MICPICNKGIISNLKAINSTEHYPIECPNCDEKLIFKTFLLQIICGMFLGLGAEVIFLIFLGIKKSLLIISALSFLLVVAMILEVRYSKLVIATKENIEKQTKLNDILQIAGGLIFIIIFINLITLL